MSLSRLHNVSESPQTIRPRSSRLSSVDEFSSTIPMDLIIEIFSRMTLKSIATCRCVSKRWASVLRRRDFTELFFTKSMACPQLLFARQEENEVIFSSSPQPPQNLGESVVSSFIAADHRVSFPVERATHISSPVNGYVCIRDHRILKGRKTKDVVYVICNPSTRQSFTLPRMKTRKRTERRNFLGYDPVEKQHKVLAMRDNCGAVEHQVLTLRGKNNGNMTWRMVECGMPHLFPRHECVCISGVLYYTAEAFNGDHMIVCFNVRSEKYSFVKAVERNMHDVTLINFQGKLATIKAQPDPFYLDETSTSLEMWILQDPEKHEWSKRIFNLPPMWKDVAAGKLLFFEGVTATNEFVFAPPYPSDPFHVYYYNFVKESITRADIQGMGAFEKVFRVHIFLNHVEDVKLM